MAQSALGQSPAQQALRDAFPCDAKKSWACFGTIEIAYAKTFGELQEIRNPFGYFLEHQYANNELEVIDASMSDDSRQEHHIYAGPSKIHLYNNLSAHPTTLNADLGKSSVCVDTLQKAFPEGPESVGKEPGHAIASVRRDVYPVMTQEKIEVKAWRDGANVIHFEYRDVGEPIGPYLVSGAWQATLHPALPDDYSLKDWQTDSKKQYKNVGEARRDDGH